MRIAPAGDRAQLVTFDEIIAAELHARAREWRAREGVLAVVPGHSSLLVVFGVARVGAPEVAGGAVHQVAVSFAPSHAPDLEALLARIHLSRDAFIERVARLRLTARFLGFRAGFAYLDGWPEEWSMPRRPTSRPVPHGSFAIAGATAGFYPIDSPGGWNLLGRTNALPRIAAGDEVTIVPTLDEIDVAPLPAPPREQLEGVEILSGPLATVVRGAEDWSRVVHGEPPGGAFDDVAAALANRAAGNAEDAPLLECAMTAPRLRTSRAAVWCGPDLEVRPFAEIGRIEGGLRGYAAFGSRSGNS
ncbi:MAG TPA: carboxyltransferase domain-containing protein, partial [Thermoanaerobaculia bacterium]